MQSSVLELRPATASDAGDIARIWREGWLDAHLGHVPRELVEARTADSFAARAAGAIASTIVATRADAVAGFVMIVEDQVDQLYLDRSARGGGVGAALLGEAERRVIASGHAHAWLAVASGNAPARRFYERQGWIDDGPFVHGAPVSGGVIDVDCHRFRSPEREH
ncbi:GNAT family N-acetyltransferase [Agromyces sp. NPDC056965]|uniref:GNAT family N-acetyltransferase n=1 Tax=Agromyces sp. NPDC056965 TaxID=3345983 RepID=UPI00363C21F6